MIVGYMVIADKCPKCDKYAYYPSTIIIKINEKRSVGPIVMKCSECGYYDKEVADNEARKMVDFWDKVEKGSGAGVRKRRKKK